MSAYQPIETAPVGEDVRVRAGGLVFLARLVPDASLNADGRPCDQWRATREDEHPPCWSDGCCWESNAEGARSAWPTRWRPTG